MCENCVYLCVKYVNGVNDYDMNEVLDGSCRCQEYAISKAVIL